MNEQKELNKEPSKIQAVRDAINSLPLSYIRIVCLVLVAMICFCLGMLAGYTLVRKDISEPTGFTEPTVVETVAVTEPTFAIETATATESHENAEPPAETVTAITEATDEPENDHPEVDETVCEAPSEPVVEETVPTVSEEDVELLACVIYQEVGGDAQCDECRYRVADIVLNRVASDKFPNTIYEVLTQPGQYGNFSRTGVVWPSRAKNPGEAHAVERAYKVARDVLSGIHSALYGEGYVWQAGFEQGSDGFWCCGHFYGR